jgi:hypothetical protein
LVLISVDTIALSGGWPILAFFARVGSDAAKSKSLVLLVESISQILRKEREEREPSLASWGQ